jgi:hypothetical protein
VKVVRASGTPFHNPGAMDGLDETTSSSRLHLHYKASASQWAEALPLGNGRLGCMAYGRTDNELLQLNEDSVWYGGPQRRTPQEALSNLPKLRQLIQDGAHSEAEDLVRATFFATPASMRHYEPLGTATIAFGHDGKDITSYHRHLDLENAEMVVDYVYDGLHCRRELLCSHVDNVIAMRITSSESVKAIVRLNRVGETEWDTNEFVDSIHAENGNIIMHATPGGQASNKICAVLGVRIDDNGGVNAVGNALFVQSSAFTVVIGAQTTYRFDEVEAAARSDVASVITRSWDEIVDRHRQDYRSLFQRTSLALYPDHHGIPTDERLAGHRDPGLVALYHSYGKYLMLSSSRDSEKPLPPNLQGLWNPSFNPAWGSKYTININLQMNYWPAARCNLIECTMPLVDLLERMSIRGAFTAKTMYGCRGWCAHHNTDIWADTDPQDRWMPATVWPLGGVWLCLDVMEILRFHYDANLHLRVIPILEGCVEFLMDFLIPSSCGKYMVTNPSLSPENTFITATGSTGILCEGSAMDMTLISMVFERFIWSTDIKGDNSMLRDQVLSAIPKLPPLMINSQGLIQEWGLHDYAEHEPGHRHVSHLFGLYPGDTINPIQSPELCTAAKRVLDRRASYGGGHTGWSRAWLLNLHARLGDAKGCHEHMELLLKNSTLPNMLDTHPPFQIDGNFGGCAGIIECLVQSTMLDIQGILSQEVAIALLPSCPKEWSSGHLSGIRTLGGYVVSFSWKDGEVQDPVEIAATQSIFGKVHLKYPSGKIVHLSFKEIGKCVVDSKEHT